MKLFGFNINRDKGIESESFQAFSSPFKKVGDGNLSLPHVDDRYTQGQGYIRFGSDNLFPQLLDQLYYTSPLHAAIIDFKVNASLGGGYVFDEAKLSLKEKVDLKAYLMGMNFRQSIKESLPKNFLIHRRVHFKVWLKDGIATRIDQIDPAKVRTNKDKSKYFISDNWEYYSNVKDIEPWTREKMNGCFLWSYELDSVGVDVYPLPSYSTANNWIFLDGEMSYLHKSNILNSVFPSFAMFFPKKPQSEEEKNMIKDSISNLKGAENAGKAAAFFANNPESLPRIEALPTNNNDQLFNQTTESIESKICQAHTIDPILMGIRVSGKLGSGTDIKQSYVIFEKNVIKPLREDIEYIVNSLLKLGGFQAKIKFNDYQIINETIIETEDSAVSVGDALNAMSPLVATKVLDNLTPNEIRALGGLAPIEGGDIVKSDKPQQPQNESEEKETLSINDNLKGLTAKDNMDIIRIVRDYNKGKLPEALAISRLSAYGFDSDTIQQILSE